MKAVITTSYGNPEVLKISEVETPVPKSGEVLVKIRATSVTASHCAMRTGKPLFGRLIIGLTKPKIQIPGTDLSGEVIGIGEGVTEYKVGDEIIAATDVGGGAHAEYLCITDKDVIAPKPVGVSHSESAGIMEGALTALPFLRDSANLKEGQRILINGASGSIGTAAVQLAKLMGAEVTGVCSSRNLDMVKDLGADEVIDYKTTDFTKENKKYDVIFDTVGKLDFARCKAVLNKDGKFLSPVLGLKVLRQMIISNITGDKKVIFAATGLRKKDEKTKDLFYISELLSDGKIKTVIDKTFSIEEIRDAHEYVETGHKRGNIVIEF